MKKISAWCALPKLLLLELKLLCWLETLNHSLSLKYGLQALIENSMIKHPGLKVEVLNVVPMG